MKQRQIILRFLLPSRQDASKAVHPAMRAFHNPTPSLKTSLSFNRLGFFATRTNMSCITKLFDQITNLTRIVTLVQTHTLSLLLCRLRTFYRNTFYRSLCHFTIMPVCTGNRQANRNTRCFCQQTSLNTFFGPIRRVWAGFFPRQAGLWSWLHPLTAMTSQSLSTHHNLVDSTPRASRKLQLGSTPEIVSGLYCLNKYRFDSMRSTDSRFAAQKRLRPWPCDLPLAACHRQNDVYSDAWAAVVRSFPTIHLKSCICFLLFAFSSLNPFKSTIAFEYVGNSGVIRIGS